MVDKESQQNNSLPKTILFDWSGTISDDRLPVYEANKQMCDYWGVEIEPYAQWLRGSTMTPVEAFQSRGVEATPDEIYEVYRKFFKKVLETGKHPTIYPGAQEVLSELKSKGIVLGIVSAHPDIYLQKEVRDAEISPLVEIITGDVRNKIMGIQEACKQLGREKTSAMYVGDTIFDIRSSKEAGVISAGIATGYHPIESLEAEHPDYLFTKLQDIVERF